MSALPDTMNFEARLASMNRQPVQWSEPTEFDLQSWADRNEVERRLNSGQIENVVDRIDQIADDLFELEHPDLLADTAARNEFVQATTAQGVEYGRWFNFGWDRSLQRYPEEQTHRNLRTFRNKALITAEEQDTLYDSRVLIAGLSVGSSVLKGMLLNGIGGSFMLADADVLSMTNTGRVEARMSDIGAAKIDLAACKVSETDPYINQQHFREGIHEEDLRAIGADKPAVIFDEVDDLPSKAMLRKYASEEKVPLIMATDLGDKTIIDVERYDQGSAEPFGGRLKQAEFEMLLEGNFSEAQKQKLMIKILGITQLTPRLIKSAMENGRTLAGFPQLGAVAMKGGAEATFAARELLLGRKLDSGRYVSNPKKTLKLGRPDSLAHDVGVAKAFLGSKRR